METSQPLELVVVGIAGFTGSALVRQLKALPSGSVRVHALVRNPNALPESVRELQGLRVVRGDIGQTPFDLFPPEAHVLVHLGVKQIDRDGSGFYKVNVEGTKCLLGKMRASTAGVLYGSSVSVYGQGEQVDISETAPLNPQTPLARSRAAAEELILSAAAARGIGAYCLRPRFLFGRGDKHTFPGLVRMVKAGLQPGQGDQRFTAFGVDDYARIVLSLAGRMQRRKGSGLLEREALHAGYTRSVSLREIVSVICLSLQLQPPRLRIPVHPRVSALLRQMPHSALHTLGTRLELFGRSHSVSVERLRTLTGDAIVTRDPIAMLAAVAAEYRWQAEQSISGQGPLLS